MVLHGFSHYITLILSPQDEAVYDAFVGGVDSSGAAYGASYNLTDLNMFTRHPEDRFSVRRLFCLMSTFYFFHRLGQFYISGYDIFQGWKYVSWGLFKTLFNSGQHAVT